MKYFLTGGTGFIGGILAGLLRKEGHEVIALVRDPAKADELVRLGIELAKGDVTQPDSLIEPMRGCDGVFHVAGWYKIGSRDKSQGQKINVEGTRNVLTAMQQLGITKGVYTSTLAINSDTKGQLVDESYHFAGTHLSEYDRTKAAAHDIALEFIKAGLPLVVVMPGLVYGPGDTSSVRTTIIDLLKGKLPMIPKVTAYCWAHVEDVAQAHYAAMMKGETGESYIIAGPPHTLEEGISMAASAAGVKMPILAPPALFRILSPVMGLLENVLPLPDEYTGEAFRVFAGPTYLGNNAKARRELGYAPRSLREGWIPTVLHEKSLL